MPWPLAIVAMVFLLAGMYYYARLVYRLFIRMRTTLQQRGYKSPAVQAGLGAIAFTLPFIITVATLDYGDENALWLILALFIALPLALLLVVRRLPARSPRTAGRRVLRFPYRAAGYVLFAAAAGALAVGANTRANLAQLAFVLAGAGLGCLAIARRAAQPDAASVMARDQRAPVIYLRPFAQDDTVFAEAPWRWRNLPAYIMRGVTRRTSYQLSLEDYLGLEIAARIGPFIALGNPVDFVPPAGSAARTYVSDEEWPQHFADMTRRARAIVLPAASSEHVMWELKEIRALGLEARLFVLTRPRLKSRTTLTPWSTFANSLRQAGYPPCGDDAGPGAVVGFKPGGEMVILKRDAKTAVEMVDAIARRLA